jgi:DNA helicase II / ATP-dependent DNA helicase PcrA
MARVYQLQSRRASRLGIDYANSLNHEQRAVATAGQGPLLVLAGAGSGKTRALTYRVAKLIDDGLPSSSILLVTFTNRAAKQMVERVQEIIGADGRDVVGGTFHHVANRVLRKHAEAIGYKPNFTILDRDDSAQVMAQAINDAGVSPQKARFPSPEVVLDVASFSINTQTPAAEVIAKRVPRFYKMADEITAVCRAYIERKAAMNLMDFDDLLMNWKVLLEDGGEIAKAVAGEYRAVLVDEYQDTNALQASIVDAMAKPHRNVTVVGDDAQCIYGFRGAEVENMLSFQTRWPDATLLPLNVNYRSTPQVLDLANASLARQKRGFAHKLVAVRPAGPLPSVVPCRDVHVQAEFVASRILELRDEGVPLDEIAILYRAHSHAIEIQVELTRRGIPFLVRSGLRFFESAHVKDAIAHLRLIFNPDDELSFRRAAKLHEGVGNATTDELWRRFAQLLASGRDPFRTGDVVAIEDVAPQRSKRGVAAFAALMTKLGAPDVRDRPGEMIRVVLDDFYADHLARAFPNARERQDDVAQLAEFASTFDGLDAFLSELALVQSHGVEEVLAADEPDEKVTLSSIHQAKGLEWSRVFLVWLNEGALPSDLALRDVGGEDEERRLFYVAATRAKDELVLTHPMASRARDQTLVQHRRSRFVDELPAEEDGGLYETWRIEIVPPAELPAPEAVKGVLEDA